MGEGTETGVSEETPGQIGESFGIWRRDAFSRDCVGLFFHVDEFVEPDELESVEEGITASPNSDDP